LNLRKESGIKVYSLKETYVITYLAFLSIRNFSYGKRHGLLNKQFNERIMLAVTEVNGCELCSYAHTKRALETGLNNEEIQNILAGINDDVPSEEMPAIMFAQHYADLKGHPSRKSWERILEIYGVPKAKGILGAVRIMMLGNTYGIPWSSIFNKLKGKPDKRSNLLYALGMVLCGIVFTPIALIHAFFALVWKAPLISFK